MACIDKNCARELIEKHRKIFEKSASGKESFRETLKKSIAKVYLVLLLIRLILIGSIWWILSSIDQMYGTLYLLLLVFVQAKILLDNNFVDIENNIVEAMAETEIDDTKIKDGEINDGEAFEESSKKSNKKEDEEISK